MTSSTEPTVRANDAESPGSEPLPFPYVGPDELRGLVLAALRRVVDPEVALSIVDLGLIYGVEIAQDCVHVRMTMTSAACPVVDVIMDDVELELEADLPAAYSVDVELCWEPVWTPEMMSARARRFMG